MNRFLKISILFIYVLTCCSDEKEPRCATCILDDTNQFYICELENGNAGLNGTDTLMDYDDFIYEFEVVGYSCQQIE